MMQNLNTPSMNIDVPLTSPRKATKRLATERAPGSRVSSYTKLCWTPITTSQ